VPNEKWRAQGLATLHVWRPGPAFALKWWMRQRRSDWPCLSICTASRFLAAPKACDR
jgi:hypothetical protein